MQSAKKHINRLVETCSMYGMEYVVISPGSRNAPLIISFSAHPKIHCLNIRDERSAAFFALGIAQQTNKAVGLLCTSGTAALNYAPAVAEAYYQAIPLVVLTADRPEEWIDQGVGQSIRQKGIYKNYIKKSIHLPQEPQSKKQIIYHDNLVAEALIFALSPQMGPVHLNTPLCEPLYEQQEYRKQYIKFTDIEIDEKKDESIDFNYFIECWNSAKKKLIIVGLQSKKKELETVLNHIADDETVVILSEKTSNLFGKNVFDSIDRMIFSMNEEEFEALRPDILISIGGELVSKKIKTLLRKFKATEHWYVHNSENHPDTFKSLTHPIQLKPEVFFKKLRKGIRKQPGNYHALWKRRHKYTLKKHNEFLSQAPFSDLRVFEKILDVIPIGSNLHLGNSTPVRYVQLFNIKKSLFFNANRGTSGIDGTVSTAIGAAFVNKKPTTIICGDIGFFYDSNALWNEYLSRNIKIIIINNGGGSIFRFIEGPSTTNDLEKHFESKHSYRAKYIAKAYKVLYDVCEKELDLEMKLIQLYQNKSAAILEVITKNELSAQVLKNYFKFLE